MRNKKLTCEHLNPNTYKNASITTTNTIKHTKRLVIQTAPSKVSYGCRHSPFTSIKNAAKLTFKHQNPTTYKTATITTETPNTSAIVSATTD